MASPLGGSDSATFGDGRDADDAIEAESGSSYIGSDVTDRSYPACPWRTDDFHDQECSRYFDCPTHVVERRLSADETPNQQDEPQPSLDDGEDEGVQGTPPNEPSTSQARPELSEPADRGELPDALAPEVPQLGENVPLPASHSGSSATPTQRSGVSDDARQSPQEGTSTRPQLYPHISAPAASEQSEQQRAEGPAPVEEPDDEPSAPPPIPENSRPSLLAQGRDESHQFSRRELYAGGGGSDELPSSQPGNQRRHLPEFVVPRWQSDAEVTYCPICHSQFNIFVRKHHCRKCGRVVCNSCSPHRIIIPHQYIVRPPGFDSPFSAYPLFDGLGAGYYGANGPSGGERVRLCNPCVPDPNTAPPQSPTASTATSPRLRQQRNRRSMGDAYGVGAQTNRYGAVFATGPSNDVYRAYPHQGSRTRSITMAHGAQQAGGARTANRRSSAFYQPPLDRMMAGGPSSSASSSYPSRYGPLVDRGSSSRRPPQIAEEDECPICHRELPPRNLPDFEALRESHINKCIQTHSTYGSPRNQSEGGGPAPAPRRTGMYTYPATEKDCIDDAECTICLEEFTVGEQMARLECLCRFHRSCIAAWFVNHPGRCPVHQHDGFGY